MSKILEVKNLHYHYGEIHALKGISLDVEDGEIVTLIGERQQQPNRRSLRPPPLSQRKR